MNAAPHAVNGILLLDKPQGITSNAALQRVRNCFKRVKAGHTGSLDPLATGMLPICLGEATKVSAYLLESSKTYLAECRFGTQTDSGDITGVEVAQAPLPAISLDHIEKLRKQFTGDIQQIPPMFSALKQQGKRLYELARKGITVDRPARTVHIHSLEILEISEHSLSIQVRCSKGTYIRTLLEDMAKSLGSVACMSQLRRLQVDPFASQMISLDALEAMDFGQASQLLWPADTALTHFPECKLNHINSKKMLHGRVVEAPSGQKLGLVRIYSDSDVFLGIGEIKADDCLYPKRLFVS